MRRTRLPLVLTCLAVVGLPLAARAQYVLWQYPTFGTGTPAVLGSGNTLYVVSQAGLLQAISPQGLKQWELDLGSAPAAPPAVAPDGTIYVGLSGGTLVAVTPSGQRSWSLSLGGEIKPPITVGPNGDVYAAAGEYAYSVSAAGQKRWTYDSLGTVTGPPAPDGAGHAYLSTDVGGFVAVSDTDGKQIWVYPNVEGNGYRPHPAQNGIYCQDDAGFLYLISADGNLVWQITPDSGRWMVGFDVGPDGTVYIGGNDSKLHAVGPDGKDKWTVPLPQAVTAAPSLGPDGLVYAGAGSRILGVDQSGNVKFDFTGSGTASAVLKSAGGPVFASFTRGAGTGGSNLTMIAAVAPGQPESPTWQPSGLSGVGVLRLAADPSKQGAAYAGTQSDLYYTSDGGRTWSPVGLRESGSAGGVPSIQTLDVANDGTAYTLVSNIITFGTGTSFGQTVKLDDADRVAVDPSNSQHIAVGYTKTGEVDIFTDGGNIVSQALNVDGLRELRFGGKGTLYGIANAGLITVLNGQVLKPGTWASVLVSADEQTLYLAGEPGLFVSTDGGKSWTQLGKDLPTTVYRVAIDPSNPQVMYAATSVGTPTTDPGAVQGINVYRSTDGGQDWSLANDGLTDLNVRDLAAVQGVGVLLGNSQGVFVAASSGVTPPPAGLAPGDLNGDGKVTISDVTIALRIAVGLMTGTPEQMKAADVAPKGAPDGKVNIQDVTRLLRRAIGLEPDPWP